MVLPPNVFVHEFITGGGWSASEFPPGLTEEAFAILWALLADFQAWGAVNTVTTLDTRLWGYFPEPPAGEVRAVAAGEYEEALRSALSQCDAALIVAPETDGILAKISRIAAETGVLLLGSSPEAILLAGNKADCHQLFITAGLPTPLTRTASYHSAPRVAAEMNYPLVVKPLDGVGCEGLCLVQRPAELGLALNMVKKTSQHPQILLQRYVPGKHVSVSLLVSGERILPLSLNEQRIEAGCPFHYLGGKVPLAHPAANQAFDLAQAAIRLIPGLQGYVGVDMVLAQEKEYLIEINPRITTSYIGLRRVAEANLAELIWNACRWGRMPDQLELRGQVTFSKSDPVNLRFTASSSVH